MSERSAGEQEQVTPDPEQTADTAVVEPVASEDVVMRIAHLVRTLRQSMRELGLDKEVEKAARAVPDARDRLGYIAVKTEQAAERALNAIDRAQPLQDELGSKAEELDERWQQWFSNPQELAEAGDLVMETRAYLKAVPDLTRETSKELLEIMMAQDFQDLTGQVIKKMMDVIRDMEFELLQVLLDNLSEDLDRSEYQRRTDELKQAETERDASLLNGPQISEGEPDVVQGQDQVDDLLEELGF